MDRWRWGWRPRNRAVVDVRLGYSAVGLGAVGFVLVLLATLVVKEVVVPALRGPDRIVAQRILTATTLEPTPAPAPVRAAPAPLEPVRATPSTPGGPTQPPEPTPTVDPGDGGGEQPGPGPSPSPSTGPVSGVLDPVAHGVKDTLDGATGGRLAPVTDAVVALVDTVSDVADAVVGAVPTLVTGLLGGLLCGSHAPQRH